MVVACSVDDANPVVEGPCGSLTCGTPPVAAPAPTEVPASSAGALDASAPSAPVKLACGIGSCLPDDAAACLDFTPSLPPSNADAGVDLDAGTPEPFAEAGVDGGAPTVDGTFERPPTDTAARGFACQLSATGSGQLQRACGASGRQGIDAACTSSLDCAPGLGCVGTVQSGRCLPFCCEVGDNTCQSGSYCVERPLRSEAYGDAEGPAVPVCERADNCSLSEPEDCTGSHCICRDNTVCMAVRNDGTTACLVPGEGGTGDPCPCKYGFHCTQSTETPTCVRTCELEKKGDVCGDGVCQSTPVMPMGYGICVGMSG
jgi:hypothetical protein